VKLNHVIGNEMLHAMRSDLDAVVCRLLPKTLNQSTSDAMDLAIWKTSYGSVYCTVFAAKSEDPPHLALADFLASADQGAP
jgi:hypothetical protein